MSKAVLVLEDGKVFKGESFGYPEECIGEVVFNTGITGYQEILTDPSYMGQIVVMTYPLIGNYGINDEDEESKGIKVKGLAVREYSEVPGNWKYSDTLNSYLVKNKIPGICGLDTRALTKYLRSKGSMKGIISNRCENIDLLVEKAKAMNYDSCCSSLEAGTKEPYHIPGNGCRVTVLDFGVKENVIRHLSALGCDVVVMPATSSFEEIMETCCDGVLLSNGPGNPQSLSSVVPVIRELIFQKPVFGICLGHQLLGIAMGGDTYKLPYGHRGSNHPVKDLRTNRVYITSQNHGFALKPESLSKNEIEITHININDNTIEGIAHKNLPVFSVQYHPEASPGPMDSQYLFDLFLKSMHGRLIA
jgi:carbamoyl-phosphate synthase small subunit